MSTTVRSYRRYLLLKVQYHTLLCDLELASAFLAKHDATDGTAFPDSVPFQVKLVAAHYTSVEDVFGSDVDELIENTSLTFSEAEAVVHAITHRAGAPSCVPLLNASATGQTA